MFSYWKELVKCMDCSSYMTPTWALSKGRRYFYYECTSIQHRGRRVCSVRSINAEVLEELVIKRIEEISRDEILLQKIEKLFQRLLMRLLQK